MIFHIEESSQDKLKIVFSGALDITNVARIWDECVASVDKRLPGLLILDFNQVDYCDGAGIALIKALQKRQIKHNNNFTILGLKPSFHKLLEYIEQQPDKVEKDSSFNVKFPIKLGHITVDILKVIRENVVFLGVLSYQLFFSLLHPKKIRFRDFLRIAEDTGQQAVPIVALIGFLIGLISTFQAAPSFADFGVQIYMDLDYSPFIGPGKLE